MEECVSENNSKKRARDGSGDLGSSSPESKRVNANTDSDPIPPESERVDSKVKSGSPEPNQCQHDAEDNFTESNGAQNQLNSPEVVKFRNDILNILDEPEMFQEIQDLDSVIRSFEEEILQSPPSLSRPPAAELTPDSGESQPYLGYLLEASDDELGLPPTMSGAQDQNQPAVITTGNEDASNGLGNIVGFENELPSYDWFELGLGERVAAGNDCGANGNGDAVTVEGWFDYSDGMEFGWQPESLPAL